MDLKTTVAHVAEPTRSRKLTQKIPDDLETGACDSDACKLPDDEEPTMEEIVYNLRRRPLSRNDLMEFLKSQYCSENLEFLVDEEAYVKSKSDDDRLAKKKLLLSQYVLENSDKQVNISSDTRGTLVKKCEAEEAPKLLFVPARREVISLLAADKLEPFVRLGAESNINIHETSNRWNISILCALVTIGITLFLWLGTDLSPAVRLVTLLPNLIGWGFFFSAKAKC